MSSREDRNILRIAAEGGQVLSNALSRIAFTSQYDVYLANAPMEGGVNEGEILQNQGRAACGGYKNQGRVRDICKAYVHGGLGPVVASRPVVGEVFKFSAHS